MNGDTGKFATLQTNSDKILKWIAKEEAKATAKVEAEELAARQAATAEVEAGTALKRRVRKMVLTGLGTLATAGGGVYTCAAVGPPSEPVVESRDVKDAVKSQGEDIVERVDGLEDDIGDLKEIAVDAAVDRKSTKAQQVEGFEYIGELIQTPARARSDIDPPEFLKAAKRRKREEAERERLFGD